MSVGDTGLGTWWRENCIKFALAVLTFVAGYIVDPFAVFSGSSRTSEDAINRILSTIYPAPSAWPSAGALARDRIALVMLRDLDAEHYNPGAGFPVPLPAHGEMLRHILCAGPAAVFVDMNFRWERQKGDAAALAEQLRYRLQDGDCRLLAPDAPELRATPVLLGFVPSASSPCEPMLPNEPAKREDCPQWEAFAPLRAVTRLTAVPGTDDTRRYHLQHQDLEKHLPASSSPALDLFLHVCSSNPGFGAGCRDAATLSRLSDAPADHQLAMRWGLYGAAMPLPAKAEGKTPPCVEFQKNPETTFGHVTNAARQLASELTPQLQTNHLGDAGCDPYHLTLGYKYAVELGSREPEVLRSVVEGRIVIYGADITAVNDVVASPVLGLLPGAHQHAMALDNLLSFGASYWRDPPKIGVLDVSPARLVEVALAVLAIAVGMYASWRVKHSKASCLGRAVYAVSFAIAAFFVSLILAVVLSNVVHWAPVNWIGIFAIALIAQPAVFGDDCLPRSPLRSGSENVSC